MLTSAAYVLNNRPLYMAVAKTVWYIQVIVENQIIGVVWTKSLILECLGRGYRDWEQIGRAHV